MKNSKKNKSLMIFSDREAGNKELNRLEQILTKNNIKYEEDNYLARPYVKVSKDDYEKALSLVFSNNFDPYKTNWIDANSIMRPNNYIPLIWISGRDIPTNIYDFEDDTNYLETSSPCSFGYVGIDDYFKAFSRRNIMTDEHKNLKLALKEIENATGLPIAFNITGLYFVEIFINEHIDMIEETANLARTILEKHIDKITKEDFTKLFVVSNKNITYSEIEKSKTKKR